MRIAKPIAALGFALLTCSLHLATAFAQSCPPAVFSQSTLTLGSAPGAVEHCLADGRDLRNFSVTLDGQPVTPRSSGSCGPAIDLDTKLYYDLSVLPSGGQGGDIFLEEWEANNELFGRQTFAGAGELAAFLLRTNPPPRWRHDAAAERIISDITTGSYSSLFVRWEPTGDEYELPLLPIDGPRAVITLPEPGRSYEVVVTANDGSCTESQTITREAGGGGGGAEPTTSTERFTVPQDGDTGPQCVDTREVPDAITSQVCEAARNGTVRVQGVGCFAYSPVRGFSGTDNACFVTCDGAGRCDTTLLEFTVTPDTAPDPNACNLPFDEPLLGQGVLCGGDQLEVLLPATPNELAGFSIVVEGENYNGPRTERIDGRDGLPATAIELPAGGPVSRTLSVARDSACAHTFQLAVRCVTPSFDTLRIVTGTPREYCLASDELFQRLGTPNLAAGGNTQAISLVPGDEGCLTASASASGQTDATLVICTRIGICDTTYLHVVASGTTDPAAPGQLGGAAGAPQASRDHFVVDAEATVEGELLPNDLLAGGDAALRLLSEFAYGTGTIDGFGRFSYTSDGSVCGLEDASTYEVCDSRGCDTAAVAVRIRCDTIVVLPGFSPNGDGVNDEFLVEGLDEYPGARLLIFNRWGNRVHEAIDYAGDWRGTFDGQDLPDGVYFYLLELPGRATPASGYMVLQR